MKAMGKGLGIMGDLGWTEYTTRQEKQDYFACIETAQRHGIDAETAEMCDNGSCGCENCPFMFAQCSKRLWGKDTQMLRNCAECDDRNDIYGVSACDAGCLDNYIVHLQSMVKGFRGDTIVEAIENEIARVFSASIGPRAITADEVRSLADSIYKITQIAGA